MVLKFVSNENVPSTDQLMYLFVIQTNVLFSFFFSGADSSLVFAWVFVFSCVSPDFIYVRGIVWYVGLETTLSVFKLELLGRLTFYVLVK